MDVLDEWAAREIPKPTAPELAGFWRRVAASMVDALALSWIAVLTAYNASTWKSTLLLFLIALVSALYKPVLEYVYGATLGKMAVGIRVTDYLYQPPTLPAVLLRNVFHFLSVLWPVFGAYLVFTSDGFESIMSYAEYTELLQEKLGMIATKASSVPPTLSVLFMFFDDRNRTLHDQIGQTLVVKK